jgi:transcriptional regulator with XRE-family HTH domain
MTSGPALINKNSFKRIGKSVKKKIGILETARRAGLSAAHVSKIFRGRRRPSLEVAGLIASVRGQSIDELYVELAEIKRKNLEQGLPTR